MNVLLGQTGGGSALASWTPLLAMMVAFGVVLLALLVVRRDSPITRRIPDNLERLTGIPGWAASTIGLALFGLLVAGEGFYSDVAWHVALGRDDTLFTAPHTSIFIGLQLIFLSGAVCIWTATATKVDTPWRIGALRIPASTLPLGALGAAAVAGFPLDELWHKAYGVDVTMWSPTHMLMILGAAFTGAAAWLVLGEAGVKPTDSRWARGIHVVAAVLTLQGLTAPLGEFSFGVPQFQQIFHPILVSIAAGFGLTAMRLVHGRWWTLGAVLISFSLQSNLIGSGDQGGPVDTRSPAVYIVSALLIEIIALVFGTDNRLRFALVSGLAIGTIGLAGEWAWNLDAYQPWKSTLLPDALVLSLIGAIGAAIAGTAYARAITRDKVGTQIPAWALALAGVAVAAVILLPLPRKVGDVDAAMRVIPAGQGEAHLEVRLTPADAADDARWFQATAWQGGGLVLRDFEETSTSGTYRTDEPVPVEGGWKSLVRLHRGGELMTLPVYLPDDPEIGEPEIPAVDRRGAMQSEKDFLLRETFDGNNWFAPIVYALLALAGGIWVAAFVVAARRLAPRRDDGPGGPRRGFTRVPVPA